MPKHKHPQPHPAGFHKAMKGVLKAEHVERLNDAQVLITLPPCLEEDEIVEDSIPSEVLVKSDKPIRIKLSTIKADTHEERIDHAIQRLKEERSALGSDARLAAFLLTFFTCEIVARSIVGHVEYKKTGRKSLPGSYSTKDVNAALKKRHIIFDQKSVGKLFSATKGELASEMSARDLRDKIVHGMKPQHRSAVRGRYESLMGTMMEFLSAVEAWRNLHRSSS